MRLDGARNTAYASAFVKVKLGGWMEYLPHKTRSSYNVLFYRAYCFPPRLVCLVPSAPEFINTRSVDVGTLQTDTVSLSNPHISSANLLTYQIILTNTQMDSFIPIANPVPSEETQVPVDFDGTGTPGSGGGNCTIA